METGLSSDRKRGGESAYRLLLYLYPGDFRQRYGEEMVDLFRHGRDRAQQRGVRTSFWLATLYDLGLNALLVRISHLSSGTRGRSLALVPAAGSGMLAVGACCAAVCCTGHAALFGSVGIAGAAFGAWFEPLRPAALGVSALMLLASAGLAYRPAVPLREAVGREFARRAARAVPDRLESVSTE